MANQCVFSNKRLINSLVKAYDSLPNHINLANTSDLTIDVFYELSRAEKLSDVAYEQNIILPVERVVITTKYENLKHLCIQCSMDHNDAADWDSDWRFTTMLPDERHFFSFSTIEMSSVVKFNFLWCCQCNKPLFDWVEEYGCDSAPINPDEYEEHIWLHL